MRRVLLVSVLLAIGLGSATRAPALAQPAPTDEPSSAPNRDAPPPNEASGLIAPRERPSSWRVVPRIVLFVPRMVAEAIFAVPRAGLWTYHRLRLKARFLEIFFNDDRTIGLFPSFFVESGFGLNAGLRYHHRDIIGPDSKLKLRAGYGGTSDIVLSGGLDVGALTGDRIDLELDGLFRQAPRQPFFGYGNQDIATLEPTGSLDVQDADGAFKTRFRQSGFELGARAALSLAPALTLEVSETWDRRSFEEFNGAQASIGDVFDVSRVPGFGGTNHLYSQLALVFDNRHTSAPYLWAPAHSSGWKLAARLGAQIGFSRDSSRHLRWELGAERLIDLYGGDRVLVLRLSSENIIGDLDRVPFVSLPTLGGPRILRGYPRGRFRDRHSAVGTIEYRYPLLRMLSGFVFVDAGQVFRRADDFELGASRVGYGIGMQLHSPSSLLGRFFVATSADGGVAFSLSFSPELSGGSRGEQSL